jgi:hypothetical protein
MFKNLPNLKYLLKSTILIGIFTLQIISPILLILGDTRGIGVRISFGVGYILTIGGYSIGRILSIKASKDDMNRFNEDIESLIRENLDTADNAHLDSFFQNNSGIGSESSSDDEERRR